MKSLWLNTAPRISFPTLEQDISTDVLVIGGGMAGVLCTYLLKNAGMDCILAEAETLGHGVTSCTTAKITVQHSLIYDKLIYTSGEERAKQYLDANLAALRTYKELCQKFECDFEVKNAYVYSTKNRDVIENEAAAYNKLGLGAVVTGCDALPFPVAGAVRLSGQAQFNPLLFLWEIAKDLPVYEHTKVEELIGTTAVTKNGNIRAKRIVVATHFPILNKHGSYFIKMYQHRSYVIALENAAQVNGMYVDESRKGFSFRNYGGLLLLGGGSHRTGKQGGNYDELRRFAARYYPEAVEKYHFATQDCITLDGVPYIGKYSAMTENLYVATGFNKWGMTSSMVAAMILCDLLCGKKNSYADCFNPSRTILEPQLAVNLTEALGGWLTPTKKRCPHLGCALHWNKDEHTWDCSCHGSRFTENGHLIDGPATGDLS